MWDDLIQMKAALEVLVMVEGGKEVAGLNSQAQKGLVFFGQTPAIPSRVGVPGVENFGHLSWNWLCGHLHELNVSE